MIKNPFVAFFFPLFFGIVAGIIFHLHFQFVIYFLLLIPFFLYFIFEKKIFRYNTKLFGIYAYFFLFILGIFVVDIHRTSKPELNTQKAFIYEGIISAPPKIKAKSVQITVEIQAMRDSCAWQNMETKVLLYVQKDSLLPKLNYGDRIVYKAKMNLIKNAGNPGEFDYEQFMAHRNIYFTAFVRSKSIIVLEHKQANAIIFAALNIRKRLMNIYHKFGIKGQQFAVLSALTLGYRDEIDRETRQMFANTGAMHILAVSGLHVGIIFLILSNLLAFMDKKKHLRILKSLIIIFSLWLFATIAGLSPSVMRSALMFSLFVIGKMLMRSTSVYNIIFVSAFVLLLINPYNILSVGFQLSYGAVLAIVFFQPYIYKLFIFVKWLPDKLWALTSVSIAAQLGTMPIGLYYFHQFPNYFFLTNILVIPLASIILYISVFLFAVSFIPFVNGAIAFVLKILLKWLIGGVSLINTLPFATMKDIYISAIEMVLIYVIILSFAMFWIYNRRQLLYIMFASIVLFLAIDIKMNYQNTKNRELIIYNVRNALVLNLINPKNIIITQEKFLTDKKMITYSMKPNWQKVRICRKPRIGMDLDSLLEKNIFKYNIRASKNAIEIGNVSFYIVRNSKIFDFSTTKKLKVDYVILSNNVYAKMRELKRLFDFKKVIFDSSNKNWRIQKWKEQCDKLGIVYFDVSGEGAWGVNIDTGKELKF